MGGILERIARIEFDNPVRTNVIVFGVFIAMDGVVGGFSALSGILAITAAIRIFGMRRPDGYLRRYLKDRYDWED